jgi:hypothetical protein
MDEESLAALLARADQAVSAPAVVEATRYQRQSCRE